MLKSFFRHARLRRAVALAPIVLFLAGCPSQTLDSAQNDLGSVTTDDIRATFPDDQITVSSQVLTASTKASVSGVAITYTIADPTVAVIVGPSTVTTAGQTLLPATAKVVVHTLKAGSTTITASAVGQTGVADQPLTATSAIVVVIPDHIEFAENPLSITGSTASKSVSGFLTSIDGVRLFGHPLKWSCPSGETIAKLIVGVGAAAQECTGADLAVAVTPVRIGSTTFRASATDDIYQRYPLQRDLTVNITSEAAGVSIAPAGPVSVGVTTVMNATFRDAHGAALPSGIDDEYGTLASHLFWSSSNVGVATVDFHGAITGVTQGQVTITAKYPDPNDQSFNPPALYSGSVVVTVGPAPLGRYGISVHIAPLNVAQGATASDVLDLDRTGGYTGGVRLTGTSDAGITISANPLSTTGPSIPFTVQVTNNVAPGTHIAQLVTIADGAIPNDTTTFAVVVTAPVTNTSFSFCALTGTPVWVAVQDGSTAATWHQVTSSNATYAFNITSGIGGIAYVTQDVNGTSTHIFYGTQAQIQAMGTQGCASGTGATRLVTGTVANTGTAGFFTAGLGSASITASTGTASFSLSPVEPGTLDLVASTVTGGASPHGPIRMLLHRAFDPGNSVGTVDFGGTSAFVPAASTFSLTNTQGQFVAVLYALHTSTNAALTVYHSDQTTLATWQLFGLPVAQMQAGDLHYAQGQAYTGTGSTTEYRIAGILFGAVAPQTAAFGPALITPTVSAPATTTTYARPQGVFTVQPEYNKLFELAFSQSTGSDRNAYFQMTGDYATGAGTVTMIVPDFSSVAGWSNSYGLLKGFLTHWRGTASSWSGTGLTFPAWTAGNTFASATKQDDFTP